MSKSSVGIDEIRAIAARQKSAKAARANAAMARSVRGWVVPATRPCADSACEATREGLTHSHLVTV